MKKIRYLVSVLFLLLFLGAFTDSGLGRSDAAMIDPDFRFSTIETEHFSVTYHQGFDDSAEKVASIAEGIHEKMTRLLQWAPQEKTRIVLIDSSDFSNGMATVLPYNMIYLYPVQPFSDTVLGEYDDWLELVLIHEYAHILTMDRVSGYSAVTRSIFGKTLPGNDVFSALLFFVTAPPNVLMPTWWLEGAATWSETEMTLAGRGRSSYVDMIFRMAVLEDALPRVDHLNGNVPYWPSGNIPYIYGMLLEKYIDDEYGPDAVGRFSAAHSSRFPYFINAVPTRETGFHYVDLYEEMTAKLRSEQFKKIDALKAAPITEHGKLPLQGERLTNPRISPDGRLLAFNRRDPHVHQEIVIVRRETMEEIATIRRRFSDHSLSWAPDSSKLYFTQADTLDNYNLYQDIYAYDIENGETERISEGLRVKDPDLSPDGTEILFIRVEGDDQNIALLEPNTGTIKNLTSFSGAALSSPRWSPDGRSILFSRHESPGRVNIELLRAGRIETLLSDGHYNINPSWSGDGEAVIYSSDRNGVYNLYALSLSDRSVRPITHLLGGAFQPDMTVDNESIVFSAYRSSGFYLSELPYDPESWSDKEIPAVGHSWERSDREETEEESGPGGRAATLPVTKEEYSPLDTVAPRFWLPSVIFDHDGAAPGVFTAGQDLLGYHRYRVQGNLSSNSGGYYYLDYLYDRWYPSLFINAYSLPFSYADFFADDANYTERRRGLVTGAVVPLFRRLETRLSLFGGYRYEHLDNLSSIRGRTVDGIEVYEGRRDNVFVGLDYSDALRYPYSISREEGRNISFMYTRYDSALGGLDQNRYELDYEEYLGIKDHHVLFLNLKGATSDGDLIAQQAFQVGGPPDLLNRYSLRGFEQGFQTGRHLVKSTLEYRFPLTYLFRGWNTKPFYWDRLHMALFGDAANVWGVDKEFDMDDMSVGAGLEVRLDMVLGYRLKLTPAVGLARGLTDDGETQLYFSIYTEL